MLSSFVMLPVLFQGFFRYEYFTVGSSVWRIDRLTQQACRTSVTPVVCSAPTPMFELPQSVPEMPGTHKWSGSTFNLALGGDGHWSRRA